MELEEFKDLPEIPEEKEAQQKPKAYLEEVRSLRQHMVPIYPMFIGRDKQGSVCIPISAISRKHAKIFENKGVFYIQDLGSINGTYLNGKRILDPIELHDGDRILLGITKDYPKGVKEFTFHTISEAQQKEQAEREAMLKELGSKSEVERKKILLRSCLFKISKKDFFSLLKAEANRRVALVNINLGCKLLTFQSLVPYNVKDVLVFSIEHPKISESIKFTIKINKVSEKNYKVQEITAEIVKISEKNIKTYESIIKPSPMICYLTSQFKE